MVDILFGEGQLAVKLLVGLIVVISLLFAFVWALRRFGGERLGGSAARGRQPRLAVIDAATVDGRRRLILIRRDNVEHLLIIGGPTDVVVEQNIVRAQGATVPGRPATAADTLPRPVPLGEGTMWPLQPDTLPRVEPAARLEPAPRSEPRPEPRAEPRPEPRPEPRAEPRVDPRAEPRLEPAARNEPPVRPEPRLRAPPAAERPPPVHEEQMDWSAEQEMPAPPPQPQRERRPRAIDPLAGLAEELARAPGPLDPVHMDPPLREAPPRQMEPPPLRPMEPPPQRQPRREQRAAAPRPQPAAPPAPPQQQPAPVQSAPAPAAAEQFNSTADQNLAEMAHRLEAALRRPAQSAQNGQGPQQGSQGASQGASHGGPQGGDDAPRAAPPQRAPRPPVQEPAAAEIEEEFEQQAAPVRAASGDGSRPQRAEPRPMPRGEAKPAAPQKSLYDSLEQEMASLLGRPNTKP
jgi:flagellar protein FliO/FliZ